MSDMRIILEDIMELHGDVVNEGGCACRAFPHVSSQEGFNEATNVLLNTLAGLLTLAELSGMSQEEITSSVGHFLTLVMAVGYSLGASDAYDVTILSDILIPDDLTEFDVLEDSWERPEDN